VFSGVRVTRSLVLCVCFIGHSENDNKVVTTVEISAGIKAKTFARVLEFLYIGNGIYSAHFIFFFKLCVV
jgi:hypothetical protein